MSILAACISQLTSIYAQSGPDYSRNFIVGTVVRVSGAKDTATVNALPVGSAMRTVNYYDGLGFPSQTVSVGAVGGGAHDLVLHKEYDRYMRESKVFLPYADLSVGSGQGFRDGAGAATSEFYRDGSLTGMSPDSAPWSVTVYGNSMLDRVLEQGFPGEVWQPSSERTDTSGRTQAYGYGTCSSSGDDVVRLWQVVSGGISSSGDYLPGRLVRQTLMGENWVSGRDGTVDVYTDYRGNTVLERRWLSEEGEDKPLDTYYVYDVLGRLRYVLPPLLSEALAGVSAASDDDSAMKAYAYVYRYDGLGECIWKRLPGCSPVTMRYDVHRRMVLSQDGNQALSGEWSCVWYDGLGRPCVMASCPSADYGDVSGVGFTASYRGSSGRTFGYVLSPELPDGAELRQVMYYDGYDFIDLSPESCRDSLWAYISAFPVHPLPPVRPADVLPDKDSTFLTPLPIPSVRVSKYDRYGRGRVTGGVIWSSDPGLPAMYSSVYYDDRGLVVQSRSQNHLGGWETEKTWYSFTGQPVKRTLSHSVGAIGTVPADSRPDPAVPGKPVVERYAWTYDNMDRPLKITHRLGSGAETVLADNRYDNLGRLSSDGRNGAEPIRTAYSYNIRSWQTGVSSVVFSEELHYTDPSACGASSAPQFNGSISSSVWSLSGGVSKGYGYSYDGLGRVTGAEWLLGCRPASGYGTSYSYDSHGNILSLSRERGSVPDGGDDLMMAYSGNQLHAMSDHGGSMIPDHLAGSIPSGMTQYAYDANGNMTRDLNSGLTVMSYNRLNLPDELTCVGSDGVRSIRYLYASDGRKLRVSTSGPGGSSSVTDYASNVVYRDGSLERILIPGGYMTDGSYRFFMTDHLGSVRAVADSEGNVLHTYDYYPYGEDIAESASAVSPSAQECSSGTLSSEPENGSSSTAGASLQPYRFNGKESQKFAGLPYLDYGARYYHPLSSRWTTMDPMAEKYYSVSPYAFCSGNPVNFVDWDGMSVWVLDEQSRNNIVNTLTKEEAKYVKFNSDGKLNTRRLNKSDSQSENMTALKSLANSDVNYNFQTSTGYPDTNGEHKDFKNGKENWENGITLIPGAESDPSPDGNVYIITNSFLSAEDQASNAAHEAYGHAYFYELQQQGHDLNPFHKYRYVNGDEVYDEFTGMTVTAAVQIDKNIQLDEQIKKVEKQARNNYKSRMR